MGTVLLSPQDCLASPHGRLNRQLTEMIYQSATAPMSGRTTVQVSRASDLARRNASSSKITAGERDTLDHRNASAGLLPVPPNHLQVPPSSLSRSSSNSYTRQIMAPTYPTSRKTTSPLHLPPSAMNNVPISISSVKLKTRSASAGLPHRGAQASAGSGLGRGTPKLSSNRLPFKIVQVDGAVNGRAHEIRTAAIPLQPVQSSKFSGVKSGFEKKRGCSERVGDFKKRAHSDAASRQENDGILSPPKVSDSYGGTSVRRKDIEGKEVGYRKFQRGNSGKNASERSADATAAITILQRPKNKEAADELIAKFFMNGDPSSSNKLLSKSLVEKGKSEHPTCFMEVDVCSSLKEQDFLKKHGRSNDVSNRSRDPTRSALDENYVVRKKDESSHGLGLPTGVLISPPSGQLHSKLKDSSSSSSYSDMEADKGCGEFPFPVIDNDGWLSMLGNERWAGPAYTNSPPPSALPLPKFPRKESRSFSPEFSSVTDQLVVSASNEYSAGTTSGFVLPSSRPGSLRSVLPVHDQKGVWDVTFATKNLRRMLNLDSH